MATSKAVVVTNLSSDFELGTTVANKITVRRATLTEPGLVTLQQLQTLTDLNLSGGSIDGTPIGISTPAAGKFSNLVVTGPTTISTMLSVPAAGLGVFGGSITVNSLQTNRWGSSYSVGVNVGASQTASFDLNRANIIKGGVRLKSDDVIQVGSAAGNTAALELITGGSVRASVHGTSGLFTVSYALSVLGNTTLGDSTSDTVTFTGPTILAPNGLAIATTGLVLDTSNRVIIGAASTSTAQKLQVVSSDALINGVTVGIGSGSVTTNLSIGRASLANATGSSGENVAVGSSTLNALTTGSKNTAVGYRSMVLLTTGVDNTGVGLYALRNYNGSYSTAVGAHSQESSSTGDHNTSLGSRALLAITTGYQNTAVGSQALQSNSTSHNNVAVGFCALYSLSTGTNNTSVGFRAGFNSTTGIDNVFVGHEAGFTATTGGSNTGLGAYALQSVTTSGENTSLGWSAGKLLTTGSFNVALGSSALASSTTGASNVMVGRASGRTLTSGSFNTYVGYQSGELGAQSSNNSTYLGHRAGYRQSGSNNTAIGTTSLLGSATIASNTGTDNTVVGYGAGSLLTSGSFNTYLGAFTGAGFETSSRRTIISDGVGSINYYHDTVAGRWGLGTTTPDAKWHFHTSSHLSELRVETTNSTTAAGYARLGLKVLGKANNWVQTNNLTGDLELGRSDLRRMHIQADGTVTISSGLPGADVSGVLSLQGQSGASWLMMGNKDSGGTAGPVVLYASNRTFVIAAGDTNSGTGGSKTHLSVFNLDSQTIAFGVNPVSEAGTVLALNGTYSANTSLKNALSISPLINSSSTAGFNGVQIVAKTAAAAFTMPHATGVRVKNAAKGAGSTITSLIGVEVEDLTQGTNNYGYVSHIAPGTNKYELFMNGGANNYFKGRLGLNTTGPSVSLDIQTTDAIRVPSGTSAQRPVGALGYFRFNSELQQWEGHNGTTWSQIGGGGGGGGGGYTGLEPMFVTSSLTATANKQYVTDSSSAAFTITLPASPADKDIISVADGAYSCSSNPVTINPNGKKINGSAINLIVNSDGAYFQLVYQASSSDWKIIDASSVNALTGTTNFQVSNSAPTARTDGSTLQTGDQYWNSTQNVLFSRSSGGSWIAVGVPTYSRGTNGYIVLADKTVFMYGQLTKSSANAAVGDLTTYTDTFPITLASSSALRWFGFTPRTVTLGFESLEHTYRLDSNSNSAFTWSARRIFGAIVSSESIVVNWFALGEIA